MKALITAVLLAATTLSMGDPAAADPYRGGYEQGVRGGWHEAGRRGREHGALSERRIARLVYREGFAEIERLERRRGRYLVVAVRPNGAVFRLSLDAHDGRMLSRERIGWSRGYDRRDYDRGRGNTVEFRLDF